jgi:hypothetical protein
MVTDAIIQWLMGLGNWFVDLIPSDASLPATLDFSNFGAMDYFLPVTEMFNTFLAFFVLGGPFAVTSLLIWVVVGVLRGGATKA